MKKITNLLDIIDVLYEHDQSLFGNKKRNPKVDPFTATQGGYICFLCKSINFLYLENNFEFSENISLNIEDDSITDSNTWEQVVGVNHKF